MESFKNKETGELVQAFQWNGSHDALAGLDIPEENPDPNSGVINLETEAGIIQAHMGYYLIKGEGGWTTVNPDYFAAHYLLEE